MISEERQALIKYRTGQADEALGCADLPREDALFAAAINRSYYAMFYAVPALLVVSDKGISKHSGAISLFDKDFIKKGTFDNKFSEWLHDIFLERLRYDYREMVVPSQVETREIPEHAREFVINVKAHLFATVGPSCKDFT